jgi:N-acetylglutamate synthase/N-acetylornithine aminotransferase
MAQFFQIHPTHPQTRLLEQAIQILRDGGVIAYPTDSGYALGCLIGNKDAQDQIRRIRGVDEQHLFTLVCRDLAEQLIADAEGASHTIRIRVSGAASESDAEQIARTLARNSLFKTAIYGNDPNWGRILAAIGVAPVEFDPFQVSVSINGVRVAVNGGPDADPATIDLTGRDVRIDIQLAEGNAEIELLTNDLTEKYVVENSAYSS